MYRVERFTVNDLNTIHAYEYMEKMTANVRKPIKTSRYFYKEV